MVEKQYSDSKLIYKRAVKNAVLEDASRRAIKSNTFRYFFELSYKGTKFLLKKNRYNWEISYMENKRKIRHIFTL